MAASLKRTALTAASLGLMAAALAGCMSTTYGTGVTPGKQTIQDIAGLVNIGGSSKGPIDYKPRPPIVKPPPTAALPPPGSPAVASASDWPTDPDEAAKARKAAAEKLRTGNSKVDAEYDPDISLPVKHDNTINWNDANTDRPGQKEAGDPAKDAEVRKLMAEAKSVNSVDANGNPIRKTLSEPPVVYRAPDPTAPTEFKTVKKTHWPWEKAKPDDATPTGLTDDAASSEKTTQ